MSKPDYPHPLIAREGWPFLAIAVVLALGASLFWSAWLAGLLWIAALFVLQFFRDPPREVPGDALTVVSPADGRVVVVEKARDPYLDRDAIKVSVFMNVFNVHSNRSPVDGQVRQTAALDKASLENERSALWLRCGGEQDVTCVQIAGLIARRILCYAKASDVLLRGQRFGFIRFGSRVDLYLPLDARVHAALGDKVQAGSTILATLQSPATTVQL